MYEMMAGQVSKGDDYSFACNRVVYIAPQEKKMATGTFTIILSARKLHQRL